MIYVLYTIVERSISDMKKRTAFIGALLSFMPLFNPLATVIGAAFTSGVVLLVAPVQALAETADSLINRGLDKAKDGDFYGAISILTRVIDDMSVSKRDRALAYFARGAAKKNLGDMRGACSDLRKSSSMEKIKYVDENIRNEC